jgi:flavorubredoxin
MICSTHGPVWTDHIGEVIGIYDRLSKYETEPGVVIAYGSMYGHTEEMAEMVARGAASVTKNVVLHDVSRSDHSYILADIFRYKGFICGSPTYCGELYPNAASLLAKIKTRGVKNHEFGCFGTLDGAVLDTELNLDKYYTEMVRYYACIVGKYGAPVQTALKKLGGLDIKMICSTHGPVWTDHIGEVIGIYDRLSKYETEPGVVIAYGSMYGHTEEMAEMVARGAASVTKNVVLHDVSRSDHSYILADIFRYKGFICGAPTYCGELYPNAATLLAKIKTRGVKNHEFGCFGSFTWANATTKPFEAFAEAMKWEVTGYVEVKQAMTAEQAEALYELGRAVALKTIK